MGEPVREAYGSSFSPEVTRDVIERVRHDFWHVQMQLFKENFIDVYNDWCHRNGLKSRVQAYGHQLHPSKRRCISTSPNANRGYTTASAG